MNCASRMKRRGIVCCMYAGRMHSRFSIASRSGPTASSRKTLRPPRHALSGYWKPNARRREMPNKRSAENEYRVTGSVLDELGLDRQAALELKLKAALHQRILQLVKRRGYRARDLERVLRIQQPRVSELMRGKVSTLSVARLLLYADLLGAQAEVKLKEVKSRAAA